MKRSAIMSLSTQFTNPTSIGRLGMWQARIQHAMWRQDYKTRFSWDNKHRFARFQQTYWMRLNRVLDNNIDHLVLPNWFKTNVILRRITIERRRKNCRWQLGKNVLLKDGNNTACVVTLHRIRRNGEGEDGRKESFQLHKCVLYSGRNFNFPKYTSILQNVLNTTFFQCLTHIFKFFGDCF